jgi:hypothetical protein
MKTTRSPTLGIRLTTVRAIICVPSLREDTQCYGITRTGLVEAGVYKYAGKIVIQTFDSMDLALENWQIAVACDQVVEHVLQYHRDIPDIELL